MPEEGWGSQHLVYLPKKLKNKIDPIMVKWIVKDIDEIAQVVRFNGWQVTSTSEGEVRKALRKTLFKYQLHTDTVLFDKAYGYIKEYY